MRLLKTWKPLRTPLSLEFFIKQVGIIGNTLVKNAWNVALQTHWRFVASISSVFAFSALTLRLCHTSTNQIMQRLFPLIAVLLFLSQTSFAQKPGFSEGIVITNELDTLVGQIKERNELKVHKGVIFITEDGTRTTYNPKEIKAYYVDGNYFESFENPSNVLDQKVFFLMEAIGKLNLYSYTYNDPILSSGGTTLPDGTMMSSGTPIKRYYLQIPGEPLLIKLTPWNFKKKLAIYLADNPILKKTVKKASFKYEKIRDIVEFYNSSQGS